MHATAESLPAKALTMPSVERVRAHYTSLCQAAREHFQGSLAGRLLLIAGLQSEGFLTQEGDALLMAASIAGAASLVFETSPQSIRYCVRNGIVDFAVNTLDQALRILKDAMRKQQPIAVLLEQETVVALQAMAERGAQPDLLRWIASTVEPCVEGALALLHERGARPVPPPAEEANPHQQVWWRAREGGSAALRQLDRLAAQVLPTDDAERQNWVARAPRYLPRATRLERGVAMNQQECAALLAAVDESAQQGTLAAAVEVYGYGQVRAFPTLN